MKPFNSDCENIKTVEKLILIVNKILSFRFLQSKENEFLRIFESFPKQYTGNHLTDEIFICKHFTNI